MQCSSCKVRSRSLRQPAGRGFLSRRSGTGDGSSLKVAELGSRRVSPSPRSGSSSLRLSRRGDRGPNRLVWLRGILWSDMRWPSRPGGHRKIWAMTRHDGHKVSQATLLQLLRDEGLLLPSDVHKQRRELAKDRKAVFAKIPNGPNQVWQLDLARVRDHNWWNLTDHGMPGLVLQA